MLATKQLIVECVYHKQLAERFENDLDFQPLTTNMLNQILHQTGELSSEYILRRTNEKCDGPNAPKFNLIPASNADQSKAKREKVQLELLIKIVDHMIHKFDIEKELSDMFD